MILCVMSLAMTICVMYFENTCTDRVPVPVMPQWVRVLPMCCIAVSLHFHSNSLIPVQYSVSPVSKITECVVKVHDS